MDRIREISDLHLDINIRYPFELEDKDTFTVICGDVAGEIDLGIEWIRKNIRRGIIVNGNHMPYGNASVSAKDMKTMAELRQKLKSEFPIGSDVSYLDTETDDFMKEVDGILFMGSCFYTNFSVSEPIWNPNGDKEYNMVCSEWNMNDYKYGYIDRTWPTGIDNEPSYVKMKPKDLDRWFCNAYVKMEKALTENEESGNPKPVVLATHYPLVTDYLMHNLYLSQPSEICSRREFIWGSYASDLKAWLKRHTSIKVHMSGHIHDVEKDYRYYSIKRENGGDDLLLMHNVRGYVKKGHARWFNPDTFVDTATWKAYERELTPEEDALRASPSIKYFNTNQAWNAFF